MLNMLNVINYLVTRGTVFIIRTYQLLALPVLPRSCRFYPTCSSYTVEALEVYGFVKGFAMGAWRLARCHPFHPGGYDPVPPSRNHIKSDKDNHE